MGGTHQHSLMDRTGFGPDKCNCHYPPEQLIRNYLPLKLTYNINQDTISENDPTPLLYQSKLNKEKKEFIKNKGKQNV